jgi:uncharacterized integral membrane protein
MRLSPPVRGQTIGVQPGAEDPERPAEIERESTRARAGRYGRRTGLYLWLCVLAVAGVLFVVLVAENTRRVKVGWVFGYSHISLVFLVVFATLLGWLLGIATSFLVRRRTRRPVTARRPPQR